MRSLTRGLVLRNNGFTTQHSADMLTLETASFRAHRLNHHTESTLLSLSPSPPSSFVDIFDKEGGIRVYKAFTNETKNKKKNRIEKRNYTLAQYK